MRRTALTQRIGWGAGILLIVLILIGITPPLIVKYKVHELTGKLHAGMSASDVKSLASGMHLDSTAPRADEVIVRIAPLWTFGGACSDEYAVVVTIASGRVTRWSSIREQLCEK